MAEAELEHNLEHVSCFIYVSFPLLKPFLNWHFLRMVHLLVF